MRKLALLLALAYIAPAHAGDKFDRATKAERDWEDCVVSAAKNAAGKAAAETIADAALSKCGNEEGEFRYRLSEWSRPLGVGSPMSPSELDRQVGEQRRRIRGLAIAAAIGM